MNQIDINKATVGKKVISEVTRYKKFTKSLLGEQSDVVVKDIDVKAYVKFILKEGLIEEKREIISCFKSKVTLKHKTFELTDS